jgi:hypothetical protein
MRKSKIWLGVMAALVLSSCGLQGKPEVTADQEIGTQVGLQVVATNPAPGSQGSPTEVRVSLNGALRRGTVQQGAFLYTGTFSTTNPDRHKKLVLNAVCKGYWRVRNPNAFPLSFRWEGTQEKSFGVVEGGKNTFFYAAPSSRTVKLFVLGSGLQDEATKLDEIVATIDACGLQCRQTINELMEVQVSGRRLLPVDGLEEIRATLAQAKLKTPVPAIQLGYTNVLLRCVQRLPDCPIIGNAHVFLGEIKVNAAGVPRATGFHHWGNGSQASRVRIEVTQPRNAQGFYKAKVQILHTRPDGTTGYVLKQRESSMWPDHWTPEQVEDDIREAFMAAAFTGSDPRYWKGFSKSGTEIAGYMDPHGRPDLATAFPIYVP